MSEKFDRAALIDRYLEQRANCRCGVRVKSGVLEHEWMLHEYRGWLLQSVRSEWRMADTSTMEVDDGRG